MYKEACPAKQRLLPPSLLMMVAALAALTKANATAELFHNQITYTDFLQLVRLLAMEVMSIPLRQRKRSSYVQRPASKLCLQTTGIRTEYFIDYATN
jgi:hypothetical protein